MLRIAQVAPLFESVPPRQYGGTERVVSHLTEELVRQGHEVVLYASGDSVTDAELRPCHPNALRLEGNYRDWLPYHLVQLEQVLTDAEEFDVIHFHIDLIQFPAARRIPTPTLTTLHGRLDLPDLPSFYSEYTEHPLASISMAQRKPLPQGGWVCNVPHGLPSDLYHYGRGEGGYLAFLGRFCPEKRPDQAIEIAKRAGIPLKMAAKVDRADQEYFETEIEPLLDHPLIENIGEIGDHEKQDFLGNARALLFPIDWPEPFGLVMIEAMACGTPVIARPRGSVREVLEPGVTAQFFETVDEAVELTKNIHLMDRTKCRQTFEERFSSERMALDYIDAYQRLIFRHGGTPARQRVSPTRLIA